jgi:Arginine-tRNA-protein transferase, C terminus
VAAPHLVYSFYEPEFGHRSLGTFMILDHIARARRMGLAYVYLGYGFGIRVPAPGAPRPRGVAARRGVTGRMVATPAVFRPTHRYDLPPQSIKSASTAVQRTFS